MRLSGVAEQEYTGLYWKSQMNRRDLLKSAAAVSVTGLSGSTAPVKAQIIRENQAVLKISSQDNRLPGATLREKVLKLEKWGGRGLELWGNGLSGRIKEAQDAIKGTQVKISAICAGFSGAPIAQDPEERKRAVTSIKELLKLAGELGSTGLVVVPGATNKPISNPEEARKVLVEMMSELGQFAVECKTRVLLKPVDRKESFFLRLLADTAAICKDINHPGVCMTADFYHMAFEETSECGAFLSAGKYLHHVHLGSRKRNLPGQDDRSFVDGFRGMKMIGYQDYCSLECDCIGNPEIEIPKSFEFLRKQWNEAAI